MMNNTQQLVCEGVCTGTPTIQAHDALVREYRPFAEDASRGGIVRQRLVEKITASARKLVHRPHTVVRVAPGKHTVWACAVCGTQRE